ncbi:LysM peptidoglycan-binding domain-containing protein [Trueperella pecoris]|uniref:LysM peptidoglycan-binding domain-containing protein n=1 Tax=Trueperella pecoris TaxID=2733571 RepID=A0A7M1QYF3_9ACTO|nr:LysM peptidoglycan-binding domain-containing protein [Trueperella pecoris]QOR46345.1 LysM peptidoglycan-binding domain-containing protein [Trueperella pecoris]QTG76171.1 LysM peptidoglycan-binding domain-containing protein [Trueperella pecoris]
MTALRMEAVKVQPSRLRAVTGQAQVISYGAPVRPDRPASTQVRHLHAVATPASADSASVEWNVASPVRADRSSMRRAVPRPQSQPQPRSRARVRPQLHSAVLATLFVAGMLATMALGMLLYTALGFGMEAGSAITVMSGESLWSIADAMGVDVPTSQIVNDIVALNSLDGAHIEAGSTLLLPAY